MIELLKNLTCSTFPLKLNQIKKFEQKKRKLANTSSSVQDSVSGQAPTCEMCNKTYKRIQFLVSHILNSHISKNNQVCFTCNKAFETDLLYRKHISAHAPEDHLCCPFCDQTFSNRIDLFKHAQLHKTKTDCNICFVNIPCPLEFRKHVQEHISSTNYKCQICHKIMNHETDMQFHVNHHAYKNLYPNEANKIKKQQVQNYKKCEVCTQSFSEKIDLKIHLDKNHSHRQKTEGCKCQVCNKSFKRKYILETHLLKHPSHKVQASNPHQHSEIIEIDGDDEDQNQNNNSKTIETHTIIDDDIQENDTIVENCVEIQSDENQINDSQNNILASMLNNDENEIENISISNIVFENKKVSSLQENCFQESINNKSIENISEKQCEDAVHITEKPVVISKELMPEISNNNENIYENISISNMLFGNKNVSSLQENCLQESINNKSIENIILEKQCEDTVHIAEKPVVIIKEVMPEISNNNENIYENISISNMLFGNKNASSLQENSLQESINDKSIENIISEKQCEDTVHITEKPSEKPVVISKEVMPEISNNNEELYGVKNNGEKVQEVENNEKIDNIYEKIPEIENNVEKIPEI